jgi:hypothetical protein
MRRAILISAGLFAFSLTSFLAALNRFVDPLIHAGIERIGPQFTGTAVSVEKVRASLFRGELEVLKLRIANPEGYALENAFTAERLSVRLRWISLLTDVLEIEDIRIEKPVVSYEGILRTNNLKKIRSSIDRYSSENGGEKHAGDGVRRRCRVKRVTVQEGEIVIGARWTSEDREFRLNLPEIELKDVGAGEGGTGFKQAASQILHSLYESSSKAVRASGLKEEFVKTLLRISRENQ